MHPYASSAPQLYTSIKPSRLTNSITLTEIHNDISDGSVAICKLNLFSRLIEQSPAKGLYSHMITRLPQHHEQVSMKCEPRHHGRSILTNEKFNS